MCYGYYNGYGMYDCCGIMQLAMGMNMIANFFGNSGHNNNNYNLGCNSNPFLVGNLLSNSNSNPNLVGNLLTNSSNTGGASIPPDLVGNLLSGGGSVPSTAYPGSAYLPGSFQFDGNIFANDNNSGLDPTGLSLYDLTSNPALYPYPSLPGVPLPESCLVDASGLPAITTGAYTDMLQSAMPMPQFQPVTPRQQTPQQQAPQSRQARPSVSGQSQQLQTQAAAPRFSQLTRPSVSSGVSLASPYNGTANDLNSKLGGQLSGKGQVFLDAQSKYGVNAGILASICIHESANGTSNLARTKNNVGGVRYAGRSEFRRYDSVDDCIMHMAKFLKSGYLDKGLTSIAQIGAKYCPTNDPTDRAGMNAGWGKGVTNIYNRDFA